MKKKVYLLTTLIIFTILFSSILSAEISGGKITLSGKKFGEYSDNSVIINALWGTNLGEFGNDLTSAPQGPISFAVDKNENIYVLDQINKRVQQFDKSGNYVSMFTIDSQFVCDIDLDDKSNVYLLDGWVKKEVYKYDSVGKLLMTYQINPQIEWITQLFVRDGNIYVEVERENLYLIGNTDTVVDKLKHFDNPLPGRIMKGPVKDKYLSAKHDNKNQITIKNIDRGKKILGEVNLGMDRPVSQIISLDSDANGNVYLTHRLMTEANDGTIIDDQLEMVVVSPTSKYLGKVQMPMKIFTDQFKIVTVSDSGNIYQMQTSEDGVKIIKWNLE